MTVTSNTADPIETRKSLWYRASALENEAQAEDAEIEKLQDVILARQQLAEKCRHDAAGLRSAAERLQVIDEGPCLRG